jgi:hypothetical protein
MDSGNLYHLQSFLVIYDFFNNLGLSIVPLNARLDLCKGRTTATSQYCLDPFLPKSSKQFTGTTDTA